MDELVDPPDICRYAICGEQASYGFGPPGNPAQQTDARYFGRRAPLALVEPFANYDRIAATIRTIVLLVVMVVGIVSAGSVSAPGAEIDCIRPLTKPWPEALAAKRFPSGFRPMPGMCTSILIHGNIEKGDYDKLITLLKPSYKLTPFVFMQSPGGDVLEAIRIGRIFRKYLISAEAPEGFKTAPGIPFRLQLGADTVLCEGSDCICASACALAWFGAVDRWGTVGLHRPRLTDPAFRALPPSEAATVYKQVLEQVSQYLDEMEVPRPMIDTMVATSSAEIRWVYSDEDHLKRPPSFAEWEDATCGSYTEEDNNMWVKIKAKEYEGLVLSEEDQSLLKLLNEKEKKTTDCQFDLIFSRADQLPPP